MARIPNNLAVSRPTSASPGEYTDQTGLQYLRARYYDPSTGTFISPDPVIGMVGGSVIRSHPVSGNFTASNGAAQKKRLWSLRNAFPYQ